jgi:hypothetical protein
MSLRALALSLSFFSCGCLMKAGSWHHETQLKDPNAVKVEIQSHVTRVDKGSFVSLEPGEQGKGRAAGTESRTLFGAARGAVWAERDADGATSVVYAPASGPGVRGTLVPKDGLVITSPWRGGDRLYGTPELFQAERRGPRVSFLVTMTTPTANVVGVTRVPERYDGLMVLVLGAGLGFVAAGTAFAVNFHDGPPASQRFGYGVGGALGVTGVLTTLLAIHTLASPSERPTKIPVEDARVGQ